MAGQPVRTRAWLTALTGYFLEIGRGINLLHSDERVYTSFYFFNFSGGEM